MEYKSKATVFTNAAGSYSVCQWLYGGLAETSSFVLIMHFFPCCNNLEVLMIAILLPVSWVTPQTPVINYEGTSGHLDAPKCHLVSNDELGGKRGPWIQPSH